MVFDGFTGQWPPLTRTLYEYAAAHGIDYVADMNGDFRDGYCSVPMTNTPEQRVSSAMAYLTPEVRRRPNLTITSSATVRKINFEGTRVTGVTAFVDGAEQTFNAREVIVCGGGVFSPTLLLRNGIGPAEPLRALGIEVVADRPGVGANLQDHLQIRVIYKVSNTRTLNVDYQSLLKRAMMGLEYAVLRRGPLTMAPSQLGVFTRSSPDYATANIQFHVQPLSLDKFGDPLHPFGAITVSVANLRPTSRGRVSLAASDSSIQPIIAPNYLATDEDRRREATAAAPIGALK